MNYFEPRAIQVMALASKEAQRLHHRFINPEHLLLGMITLNEGIAIKVLLNMGVNLLDVRSELEKQIDFVSESPPDSQTSYTPRAKKVIALAGHEAKAFNHRYIGTEHLLLGMLRENESLAATILKHRALTLERVRVEILRELDPNIVPSAIKGTNAKVESQALRETDRTNASPPPDAE